MPEEQMEIIEDKSAANLKQKLLKEINTKGGMSMARFMHLCLADPQYGYYTTKHDIFNKKGDFTTSPEISQMFGEILGVWFISLMEKYKNLKHFNLVEMGPGTGKLSWDILRWFKQLNVLSNMTFYYVEISDKLKELQQDNIIQMMRDNGVYLSQDLNTKNLYETKLGLKFIWEKDLRYIMKSEFTRKKEQMDSQNSLFWKRAMKDDNPFIVLGNELFDAIPVYQFVYDEYRGWLERIVWADSDKNLLITTSQKPTLNVEKLLQPHKTFASEEAQKDLKTGDMIEISPHSMSLAYDIAQLWSITKGASLIIDYGEDQALCNSIRAIKNHKYLSEKEMLETPGTADLSAYVNFQSLRETAKSVKGITSSGPIPQGLFLEAMGMNIRLQVLKKKMASSAKRLETDYQRLVHPDQMGEIYKVLYIGCENTLGDVYPFLENTDLNKLEYK